MSKSPLVTFEDFKTGLVELIERMNGAEDLGDDCGEISPYAEHYNRNRI